MIVSLSISKLLKAKSIYLYENETITLSVLKLTAITANFRQLINPINRQFLTFLFVLTCNGFVVS